MNSNIIERTFFNFFTLQKFLNLGRVSKHLTSHSRYPLFAKNVVIALCILLPIKKCRQVYVFVQEINKHETTKSAICGTRLSWTACPPWRRPGTSTRTPVSSWHRPRGARQNDAVSLCSLLVKVVQSMIFCRLDNFPNSQHSFPSDPFFCA